MAFALKILAALENYWQQSNFLFSAKPIIFLKFFSKNLYRVTVKQDFKLVDDGQEDFRQFWSTESPLSKSTASSKCSSDASLRRRKTGLSVLLYLDIKNTCNTLHWAWIISLSLSFWRPIDFLQPSPADIFLYVGCSPPSPWLFKRKFNPFPTMIRAVPFNA